MQTATIDPAIKYFLFIAMLEKCEDNKHISYSTSQSLFRSLLLSVVLQLLLHSHTLCKTIYNSALEPLSRLLLVGSLLKGIYND